LLCKGGRLQIRYEMWLKLNLIEPLSIKLKLAFVVFQDSINFNLQLWVTCASAKFMLSHGWHLKIITTGHFRYTKLQNLQIHSRN